jgi:ubiquinol-cytochrome c reductase cytochrome b subunit
MADSDETKDSVPFYPDHVRTEALVVAGVALVVLAVGVAGMIWPVGLEAPADPMNTPLHVKAHWYFVFLQEMLKFIPKDIGVVIPVLAVLVLALWPFLDRKADSHRARRFRIILAGVVMTAIVVLTIVGSMS